MLRHTLPIALALLLAMAALPSGAQAEPPIVLRLEGHEGPLECDVTAPQLLCFQVVEGDLATAFVAGRTVRVELTAVPLDGAPVGAPHNLAVILDGEQGTLSGIDSDSANAIAISDTAESGSTVTLEFTVPATGTLYFWCDVGEHEFAGMNLKSDVQAPPAENGPGSGGDDNDTSDNDTSGNDTADNGTTDNGTSGNGTGADMGEDGSTGSGNETAEDTDADVDPAGGEAAAADDAEESPFLPALALPVLAMAGLAWARRRG